MLFVVALICYLVTSSSVTDRGVPRKRDINTKLRCRYLATAFFTYVEADEVLTVDTASKFQKWLESAGSSDAVGRDRDGTDLVAAAREVLVGSRRVQISPALIGRRLDTVSDKEVLLYLSPPLDDGTYAIRCSGDCLSDKESK